MLLAIFWIGWAIALLGTFPINHFDLFGLEQVCAHWQGWGAQSPSFKRHCSISSAVCDRNDQLHPARHPAGRARLVSLHGQAYVEYRRRVPMIIPLPPKKI